MLGFHPHSGEKGGCEAVHLLSISKQFDRAVQLCSEHDVHITEDMLGTVRTNPRQKPQGRPVNICFGGKVYVLETIIGQMPVV